MTVTVRIRRRVSLAGQARAADGSAVNAGRVCMTRDASVNHDKTVAAPGSRERSTQGNAWHRDATLRPDGIYFFLDVPPGDHAVGGHDDQGRLFDVRAVTLPPTQAIASTTASTKTSPTAPAPASDAPAAGHATTTVAPLLGFDLVILHSEAATRPTS